MSNRWSGLVSADQPEVSPALGIVDHVEVLVGAAEPQPGVPVPAAQDRLGHFVTTETGPFWVGVHGGAGESVLAETLGGTACGHRWPARPEPGTDEQVRPAVFLVARQNRRGLEAARAAARDWAYGAQPQIELLGLVVIADAPGKTPRELAALTKVIAGGVPRTWVVPWIEELRVNGAVDWESLAREPRKVFAAVQEAAEQIDIERNS